jgi:hypothetical protein
MRGGGAGSVSKLVGTAKKNHLVPNVANLKRD